MTTKPPAYLKNSAPLVEQGKAVVMMTWGALGDNGDIIRDPTFPVFQRLKRSAIKLTVVRLLVLDGKHGRLFSQPVSLCKKPLFLPAGTPNDVIATFNTAFKKVVDRQILQKSQQAKLGKYPVYTGAAAGESTSKCVEGLSRGEAVHQKLSERAFWC